MKTRKLWVFHPDGRKKVITLDMDAPLPEGWSDERIAGVATASLTATTGTGVVSGSPIGNAPKPVAYSIDEARQEADLRLSQQFYRANPAAKLAYDSYLGRCKQLIGQVADQDALKTALQDETRRYQEELEQLAIPVPKEPEDLNRQMVSEQAKVRIANYALQHIEPIKTLYDQLMQDGDAIIKGKQVQGKKADAIVKKYDAFKAALDKVSG